VAEPLGRHDGVINQFQGDAILATFNAPRLNDDHAANAIRAALEIEAMLGSRTFGDGLVLRARIGINTGVVIHGLIGTPDRLGYTVIGDEVNIAARLEALNKQYGTLIIVSEQTRERARPGSSVVCCSMRCSFAAAPRRPGSTASRTRSPGSQDRRAGAAGFRALSPRIAREMLGRKEVATPLQAREEPELAAVVLRVGLRRRLLAQQRAVAHELLPRRTEACRSMSTMKRRSLLRSPPW
jgi:hypothetical protein